MAELTKNDWQAIVVAEAVILTFLSPLTALVWWALYEV